VHIAYQQYLDASKSFRRAQEVSDVDERLYEQIRNRNATDIGGSLERISAKVSAEVSQLQRYQAYAEAQAALGRLYAAQGVDPLPEDVDTLDFAGLSRALHHAMIDRNQSPPSANAGAAGSSVASRADEPAVITSASAGEPPNADGAGVAAAPVNDQNSSPSPTAKTADLH
jgi:hypothetical protein